MAQEEIRDLLLADAQAGQSVHIREVPGGGICLAGATEKEVVSKAQMADLLCQGTMQVAFSLVLSDEDVFGVYGLIARGSQVG